MNYLADTNLVSEPTKPTPNAKVLAWLRANKSQLYVSSITVGLIQRRIAKLADGRRKANFQSWLDQFCEEMEGRILSFNASTAHVWGQLTAKWERSGVILPVADSYIAATAQRHRLTVVTRNISDFQKAGGRVINPFGDSE